MKWHIVRYEHTDLSTIGKLDINGVFQCLTLENRRLQIAEGTFTLIERWSHKHGCNVLGIQGVPGRTDIEIHPANEPHELLGCVAPGKARPAADFISNSKDAFGELMSKFRAPSTIQIESIHLDIEKPDASEAIA